MNASQKSEARKFWKDAYLVALGEMVNGQVWTDGRGNEYTDVPGRSEIARDFANEAVKNLKKAKL